MSLKKVDNKNQHNKYTFLYNFHKKPSNASHAFSRFNVCILLSSLLKNGAIEAAKTEHAVCMKPSYRRFKVFDEQQYRCFNKSSISQSTQ
jgi:hypothetical protein